MRQVFVSAALAAIFIATGTNAWWCTGHMAIAAIAKKNLEAGVLDAVNKEFTFINQWFDETVDMVTGACWADDLKTQKLGAMEQWHFVNQVYNPTNFPIALGDWPMQVENVESQIMGLQETLKEQRDNNWIRAFATANLVHFFGDIHQPLHATERFSETYPQGDRGGNLIKVVLNGQTMVLHAVWDSVCGLYPNAPARPLSPGAASWIDYLAEGFIANYTVPEEDKKTYNSTVMAIESFEAAIKYSYDNNNVVEGQVLTQDYINTCISVAGYRIAYAGFRLANELNFLFGEKKTPTTMEIVDRVLKLNKEADNAFANLGKK